MPATGPSKADPTGLRRQIARERAAEDRMARALLLEIACSRNYGDTMHVVRNGRTVCGKDAADWPRLEPMMPDAFMATAYRCSRCAQKMHV